MSRRILITIIGITTFAVAGFGLALGAVVANLYHDQAVIQLQRDTDSAAVEVPASLRTANDPIEVGPTPKGSHIAVYDTTGARVAGDGPNPGDALVSKAARGTVSDAVSGHEIAVAVPLLVEDQVYAVIRASRPRSEVDAKVHRAWLAMAGLGLIVIGVAALIAWRQTRVLTRPVTGLTGAAARLGDGDFATRAQHSGIAELDAAADALNVTAVRLGTLLQRERAFTADASHQLRTPLTALSIELEAALLGGDADLRPAINDALDTVDQIQITIDDLTALGRDVALPREPLDLHPVMLELERRWSGQIDRLGRSLVVRVEPDLAWPTISEAAVRQIMDVLVANAVEHGAGTVTVTARATGGGVALEVSDEGRGVEQPIEQVFRRRTDPNVGRGIGLALARSLAEAEGGRLLLESSGPAPTFRLLMPAAEDAEPAVP